MHTYLGDVCGFCLDEGTYCELDLRDLLKEWIECLCPECRKLLWPLSGPIYRDDLEWADLMVKGIIEPTWDIIWKEFGLWNRHRHRLSPSPYLQGGVRQGVHRMAVTLLSFMYLRRHCHCNWDTMEMYCVEIKFEIEAWEGKNPRSSDLINNWLRLTFYSAARRTQLQGRLLPDPKWGPKEESKFTRWQDLVGHTSDDDTE